MAEVKRTADHYRKVDLSDGRPLGDVILNATTRKTFESTDADRDLVVCEDADDMFTKLGI